MLKRKVLCDAHSVWAMFDVIVEEEPKAEDDDVNHDDLEDGGMEAIDAGEG